MKRTVSFLLAAAMFVTLAACGKKVNKSEEIAFYSSAIYRLEDIALPVDTGYLWGSCTDGKNLYFVVANEDEDNERHALFRADWETDEVAQLADYYPAYGAEKASALAGVGLDIAPDGTLWSLESWTLVSYDLPDDFDENEDNLYDYVSNLENSYVLRQLDTETGRNLKTVNISEAVRELGIDWIYDWTMDYGGRIFLAAEGQVAVLDNNGQILFTVDAELTPSGLEGSDGGVLARLSDGSLAVLTVKKSDGSRVVRTIDTDVRGWRKNTYQLSGNITQIYDGRGENLFFYIADDLLFGWVAEGEMPSKLLSWSSAQLSGSAVTCFILQEEGQAAALTRLNTDGSVYSGKLRLSRLTPTDKTEDGRSVLVYGTIDPSDAMRYQINQFNENSDAYYIEIWDYAEGLTGDWSAVRQNARMRAYTEIAAGRMPDLIDGNWIPISVLAGKGLLENLWPYIDNDPELGRDALMTRVLDSMEMDGRLYQVCNSFTICTAYGLKSLMGDRTSIALDEVLELYKTLPSGSAILGFNSTPQDTLLQLASLDRYVDWSAGTCRFDSGEFVELLELCGQIENPGGEWLDDGGTAFREGRQLLDTARITGLDSTVQAEVNCGGPESLINYDELLSENGIRSSESSAIDVLKRKPNLANNCAFGAFKGSGYASFVGYPEENHSGSYFMVSGNTAISAACEDKDGAWSFVRQLLLPSGSMYEVTFDGMTDKGDTALPINRADFEQCVADAMESEWIIDETGKYALDKDGQQIEEIKTFFLRGDPMTMVVYMLAPTQEHYDRLMELYNATDRVYDYDITIRDIVIEMTGPFFAGDKSAEETAKLVQGRVQLYLDEQR